jgi:hypothetical protein
LHRVWTNLRRPSPPKVQGRCDSDRRLIEAEGDAVLRLKERPGSRTNPLRADDSGDDNADDNPAPPAQ